MAKNSEVMEVEKQELTPAEGTERLSSQRAFLPRTNIYETNDKVVLYADMPGVDAKSLDVQVEKNVLTINGTVKPETYENHTLTYAEYEVGDYQRRFTLSNEVDISKIEATIKNGVLKLDLPKVVPTTKKIAVKAA